MAGYHGNGVKVHRGSNQLNPCQKSDFLPIQRGRNPTLCRVSGITMVPMSKTHASTTIKILKVIGMSITVSIATDQNSLPTSHGHFDGKAEFGPQTN